MRNLKKMIAKQVETRWPILKYGTNLHEKNEYWGIEIRILGNHGSSSVMAQLSEKIVLGFLWNGNDCVQIILYLQCVRTDGEVSA